MKIFFILCLIPYFLYGVVNPYTSLKPEEKLNIIFNFFLNQELKNKIIHIPVKDMLKDDGASLSPVKYEFYFTYIQRLKAIKESRAEEQNKIDIKYINEVSIFNGKLKKLKKFYEMDKNIKPIIEESINKAFTVVFGKPIFTHMKYNDMGELIAMLDVENIYNMQVFKPMNIKLYVNKGVVKHFIQSYDQLSIDVRFKYDGTYITYDDIYFTYNQNQYVATFLNKRNIKYKIVMNIDENIFKPIKLKSKEK